MKPAHALCEPIEVPAWNASFPVPASSVVGGRRAAELAAGIAAASTPSAPITIEFRRSLKADPSLPYGDHLTIDRGGQVHPGTQKGRGRCAPPARFAVLEGVSSP